jgi:hypothetical protein
MMSEQRVITERRSDNRNVLVELQKKVDAIHDRVYDGMPAEIRGELAKEISKLNTRLWGLLSALFMALIAIVVTVLISSGARSMENQRNYKEIIDIGARLDIHLQQAVKP